MIGEAHPALPGLETSVLKLSLWRFALYLLVILTGLTVSPLTFLPRDLAQSWPSALVSLGLDLRGGASLTLRADEAATRTGLVSDFATALTDAEPGLTTRSTDDG